MIKSLYAGNKDRKYVLFAGVESRGENPGASCAPVRIQGSAAGFSFLCADSGRKAPIQVSCFTVYCGMHPPRTSVPTLVMLTSPVNRNEETKEHKTFQRKKYR